MMEMVQVYKKGQQAELDAAWQEAEVFGKVKLAPNWIFWQKGLRRYALPLGQISRAWRRVQQVTAKTCCATSDFSIHSLLMQSGEEAPVEIPIGEALYRHEPEHLLERLHELRPNILIGKP